MAASALVSILVSAAVGGLFWPPTSHRVTTGSAPPVQVRVPAIHSVELAASGLRVRLDLRSRRAQRVRVTPTLAVSGAKRVTLSSPRSLTLRPGKPHDLRFALTRSGRAALAECRAAKVVLTLTGHDFSRPRITTAGLRLDPPSCGRFFSPTSFWNRRISRDVPLDPQSAGITAELEREVNAAYHSPAPPTINTTRYAPPIYSVAANQRLINVHLDRPPNYAPALASAFAAVPLPPNAVPDPGTDSDLVVWQPARDTLWEFWRLRHARDGWHAQWGGRMQGVSRSPGAFTAPNANWGASASSLAVAGGLITPHDLRTGKINHALGLAVPMTRAGFFSLPAQRTDGLSSCPNSIPEGAHFRLDPALDLSRMALPPITRMLAEAAQKYGIFVRDRAGTVAFFAQNPISLPANPYPALFGGASPTDLLRSFPWSHLQLLAMQLQQAPGGGNPITLQDLLGCH